MARTPGSQALHERASKHLPYGVASTFHANDPYPIYLERGQGSHVWDVDGTEYLDFHGGFGVNVVGHAHPKVVEAIERAARTGTHFATTTPTTVALAEELCRRFHLDTVRFTNSGTEATMDAIRIARAATGRDRVLKIEGSYHGHHDTVMFSVVPNADAMGGRDQPASTPMSKGIPAVLADYTLVVPFNDVEALDRMLSDRGSEIACLIMEPVMMNIGVVVPQPGYLEAARDLCTRHGVVLIFDEVKSGATIAAGGAIERFGVQPHLACFAKAIGGGTPIGAFGGDASVMEVIEHGAAQQGTFNGNPLVAAAGLAALTEVLTPDAYAHLAAFGVAPGRRLRQGDRRARHPRAHRRPRGQGVRLVPARAAAQLPRLPRDPHRVLRRVVPVDREPGRVHDPRRRGAVDHLGAAHRRRRRPLRRRVRRVRGRGQLSGAARASTVSVRVGRRSGAPVPRVAARAGARRGAGSSGTTAPRTRAGAPPPSSRPRRAPRTTRPARCRCRCTRWRTRRRPAGRHVGVDRV